MRMLYKQRNSVLVWLLSLVIIMSAFILVKNIIYHKENSVKDNLIERDVEVKYLRDISPQRKDEEAKKTFYDHDVPLIFVGGSPRSGTTLMRTMLDAHSQIRCGPETRIIPKLMDALQLSLSLDIFKSTLKLNHVLKEAIGEFVLNVMKNNGPPATYLCDKDPMTFYYISLINEMFPNMKYVLMVRDPRAVAHSLKTRKIFITGVDIDDYRDVLVNWNTLYVKSWPECQNTPNCLLVHYEDLILRPVETTKNLFQFLNIYWSEDILHHEKHINSTKIAENEPSTDQVKKALYLEALTSWFDDIPYDVLRDVARLAPVMMEFGYDPYNFRPGYGDPDDFVLKKGIWSHA